MYYFHGISHILDFENPKGKKSRVWIPILQLRTGTLLFKKKSNIQLCFKGFMAIIHNGLKTGIKRTTSFRFASAVKTLSDSIFPCFLQLKHSKWQIFINFIFLSQFHNFISFWWVHVQFQLQGLYNYVLLIEECDKIFSM